MAGLKMCPNSTLHTYAPLVESSECGVWTGLGLVDGQCSESCERGVERWGREEAAFRLGEMQKCNDSVR